MEERINVAELLKDCPIGMELDCTVYDNVEFEGISDNKDWPIKISVEGYPEVLNPYGCISYKDYAKCVIFPKGKITWKGFVPPCIFKDGDIVATNSGNWTAITKGGESGKCIPIYCVFKYNGEFEAYCERKKEFVFSRLATEEEKQKLFQIIKNNGYKWNSETKTLEKLLTPKFKMGDNIRIKGTSAIYVVAEICEDCYMLDYKDIYLYFETQDEWELVPNKFDITTLKPFDTVLVKSDNSAIWECDFFSSYNPNCSNKFHCIGAWYNICIPYKNNEHLLGTTNDCSEYYKTWE